MMYIPNQGPERSQLLHCWAEARLKGRVHFADTGIALDTHDAHNLATN